MRGPEIITRTLSVPSVVDRDGRLWQYHSRSDQHSKVACWAILFDLLETSSLLPRHLSEGKAAFGINRQINDWTTGRRKDLDLVVSRSGGGQGDQLPAFDLSELAARYKIVLTPEEARALAALPVAAAGASGATVLVALEAKATMTAHVRALPRLYDELTSSHATVHGDNVNALAVGFVMINLSDHFVSPGRQAAWGSDPVLNEHKQPADTMRTLAKLREIPRRAGSHSGQPGFDALGAIVINMANDDSPVELVTGPPAPAADDDFNYDRMITRAAHLYDSSFGSV